MCLNRVGVYKYFIHLHTKKSIHSPELTNWRQYLLNTLIGSKAIARSNLFLLSQQDVGVIFAEHYLPLSGAIMWGKSFLNVKKLLSQAGVDITEKTLLEFPSSSMIFAKTATFNKLLQLNIGFDDFEEEVGQLDATLAHAYERSLLYFAESEGFRWCKVSLQVGKLCDSRGGISRIGAKDQVIGTKEYAIDVKEHVIDVKEFLENKDTYPKLLSGHDDVYKYHLTSWKIKGLNMLRKLKRWIIGVVPT